MSFIVIGVLFLGIPLFYVAKILTVDILLRLYLVLFKDFIVQPIAHLEVCFFVKFNVMYIKSEVFLQL